MIPRINYKQQIARHERIKQALQDAGYTIVIKRIGEYALPRYIKQGEAS